MAGPGWGLGHDLGTYLLTASYQCPVSQLCLVGADIGLDCKVECGVLQGFIFAFAVEIWQRCGVTLNY